MDPFSSSPNAPAHRSGAAGQPPVTHVAQLNSKEAMTAWNHLKLQKAEKAAVHNISSSVPSYADSATATDTVGKRGSKTKPPASGIRRPQNSWIIYRTARQAEITKAEGPMPNSAMFKSGRLTPSKKRRWEDLAWQEKLEHKRKNPYYKYQPRRPGEIKKRNTKKVAGVSNIPSPAISTVSLTVAGTSATPGTEDIMVGLSIADADEMSPGELLAHYTIYNNLTPVVGCHVTEVPEGQEWVNETLINYSHNSEAVSGEAHKPERSPYATSTDDTVGNSEETFDFGALARGGDGLAILQDPQPKAPEPSQEGGSDYHSLFGDPVPDYNMVANDWLGIMNKESFRTP
ncbi:hypothetical protein DL764_006932 [Monosporascus ibericus]|uniref:HMG box domain-containing protein n=1 Tax=Monosporascus ibericus TaxID=155417 RepID=A0A4Q4T3S8_9PEZI|nr:hypothetical protein DL764_006932 [Monosporascus ibericus]